jgi:hypothetical protein
VGRSSISVVTVALSVLCALLLGASATSGLIENRFSHNGHHYELALRVALLGAAVFVGWRIFGRLERRHEDAPREVALPGQPADLGSLRDSAVRALDDQKLSLDDVLTFVALVSHPSRYRPRVAETVTLEERVITQHVSVEFALPETEASDVPRYVPLLSPVKGQLVDNFRLTDAADKTLSDLSFEETTRLAAAGLMVLLRNAAVGDVPPPGDAATDPAAAQRASAATVAGRLDTLHPDLLKAFETLLRQITRRGPATPDADDEVDSVLDVLVLRNRISADGRKELRAYVLALTRAYPIVAVAPKDIVVGDRVLLRYERALIPTTDNTEGVGLLRVLLGIKPYQIALPLKLASTAASYHMRLNGPTNKYVLGQHFRCRKCRQDVARDWLSTDEPRGLLGCYHIKAANTAGQPVSDPDRHYRVRPRNGQSFVHLYLRGFGGSTGPQFRDLDLFAQFKEVPPGSRAVAVVTAAASTVLVGLMGHLVSIGAQPVGGVPALLLAIPAAAASWFGFSADAQSLVGSSLLARLSQLITATVCFVAMTVYFTSHRGHLPAGLAIVGISEPLWASLFVVSAGNFVYVSYRFTLKLLRYHGLVQKKDQVDHGVALR